MLDITDPFYSLILDGTQTDEKGNQGCTGFRSSDTWPSWSIWDLISLCDLSTFFISGELITRFKENPEALYVVGSGAVKSFYYDAGGNERITAFYLPGEILGLEGFNRKNLSISHQMLKTGHLFRIPYSEIFLTFNRGPNFQKFILEMISYEMFDARRMSIINGHCKAEVRLAYFLLNLWARIDRKKSEEAAFSLPMTRAAISNFLGLTPETISRCLTLFKKKSWIETWGSRIRLMDIESLTRIATGIPI